MQTIRIRRVYDPPSPSDGRRILVDRMWPRGVRKDRAKIDDWIRELAPSTELRRWFGHDPARWQEFAERYGKELRQKRDLLDKLRAEGGDGAVTLLFAAKDREHNNAVVLKEFLDSQH